MTDISLCRNEDCPSKKDCYRYTANPDKYQAYSKFDFGCGECCEDYIPNGKYESSKK